MAAIKILPKAPLAGGMVATETFSMTKAKLQNKTREKSAAKSIFLKPRILDGQFYLLRQRSNASRSAFASCKRSSGVKKAPISKDCPWLANFSLLL